MVVGQEQGFKAGFHGAASLGTGLPVSSAETIRCERLPARFMGHGNRIPVEGEAIGAGPMQPAARLARFCFTLPNDSRGKDRMDLARNGAPGNGGYFGVPVDDRAGKLNRDGQAGD